MKRAPESFVRARLTALYLLSLAAVLGSLAAWHPDTAFRPLNLLWPPGLAAAALAGALLYERLFGLLDRHARARIRSITGLAYGAALLIVSLGLLSGVRGAADSGCSLLRGLQPLFLVFAGFGRGHLGTLVNAFALTCTSMLAGGPGAAASATLNGGLFVVFLTADQAVRSLSEFPVEEMPVAGPVLLRGILPAAAVAAVLAAFFWLLPPAPYAPLQKAGAISAVPAGQLIGLLSNLTGVAILSAVAFYVLLRLGGGPGRGGASEEPVVEFAAARRTTEKPAGVPYVEPAVPAKAWRARIVAVYVKTTEQLAKWGRRRRPHQTPKEFARTLAPAGASDGLSELFGRARYGNADLTEADYERASQLSREILDHHRGRG